MDEEVDGSWICPKCGEPIEPEFDSCWRCGSSPEDDTILDPAMFHQVVVDTHGETPRPRTPPLPSIEGLETPCPICGGVDYAWGNVESAIFVGVTDFQAGFRLAARLCRGCSNVQTFVKWPA